MLRSLWRHPRDVPALARTALDARTAFMALQRSRMSLGALLGFTDQHAGTVDAASATGHPLVDLGMFAGSGEVQIDNP